MNQHKPQSIFEKFNPISEVIRCPNGKSSLKKELDLFAQAATHLYGIITRKDFVEVYNYYHEVPTSIDEVYILLLPLIVKQEKYSFLEDYLVHPWFREDHKLLEYMSQQQNGKSRYLPSKEEFLEHVNRDYLDSEEWNKVLYFMLKKFDNPQDIYEAFTDIRFKMSFERDFSGCFTILEKNDIQFRNEEEVKQFMDLIMTAANNTRIWENNGYTPVELSNLTSRSPNDPPQFARSRVVGRNESCPCGSGKKYKNCCYISDSSIMNRLTTSNRELFFRTWLKLLDYVNHQLNVVDYIITPNDSTRNDDRIIHQIREKLWENPHLIDNYLANNKNLPQEELELLHSWSELHIKGRFLLLKCTDKNAILLQVNEEKTPKLYSIIGITNPISQVVQRKLPTMIETVLLPFHDQIIYDGFIATMPFVFGKGAKNMIENDYIRIMKESGIITKL